MSHAAVILAAGGSTRLGRPKQLLTRDGETLVHRATRLALETGAAHTLVITGAGADEVTAAVADLACSVVFNPRWPDGLAASLAIAATHLPASVDSVLVLGCDQPRLDAWHLRQLLRPDPAPEPTRARAGEAKAPFAAPMAVASGYAGTLGIPVRVPATWLRELDPAGGDRGLGARLRDLSPMQCAMVANEALADDIDTPADLAAARAVGWIDTD